mmetsp:Transcript_28756/g.56348  ORF Transcript_28756/g.56348 Transcript_28756/m.56348 type:complete len:147 (-) Transcript_28756:818-1258(-)
MTNAGGEKAQSTCPLTGRFSILELHQNFHTAFFAPSLVLFLFLDPIFSFPALRAKGESALNGRVNSCRCDSLFPQTFRLPFLLSRQTLSSNLCTKPKRQAFRIPLTVSLAEEAHFQTQWKDTRMRNCQAERGGRGEGEEDWDTRGP